MTVLNSKVEYALAAVLDLARNYDPGTTVKAQEIAERTGAPEKYLGQILRELKKNALVKSEQGPGGGYRLMRRPELISVAEVMAAVATESDGRRKRSLPSSEYAEALHWLSGELEEVRRQLLVGINLKDFLRQVKRTR